MSVTGGERQRSAAVAAAAVAGAVLYVLLIAATAGGFADHDVFVMARVARDVLDGKALYSEAWDNKAPLAILFYAVPAALAPTSYTAVQVWLGIWLVVQAAVLWAGLGRESGAARKVAVAVLLLLPIQRAEWCWASSEHAGNLFVIVALVVAWRGASRRRLGTTEAAIAGAAVAAAFNVRQNQVLFGMMLVLTLLMAHRGRWREALRPGVALVGGFVAMFACVLAVTFVLAGGTLSGYVRTVLLAPGVYGRSWSEVAFLVFPLRNDVTLFVIFASALLAMTSSRRWFATTLALTTVAVMLLPMRGYPHYWVQAFPATALLAAMAADALRLTEGSRRGVHGVIAAAVLAVPGIASVGEIALSGERESLDRVVTRIEAATGPGDTVFAAGYLSAYLYFATKTETPHPIFWQDWMYESLAPVLPVPLGEVVRDYLEKPPAVIALDAATLQRVLRPPAPDEQADVPLIRSLLAANRYLEVARQDGWHVLRKPPPR